MSHEINPENLTPKQIIDALIFQFKDVLKKPEQARKSVEMIEFTNYERGLVNALLMVERALNAKDIIFKAAVGTPSYYGLDAGVMLRRYMAAGGKLEISHTSAVQAIEADKMIGDWLTEIRGNILDGEQVGDTFIINEFKMESVSIVPAHLFGRKNFKATE